MVFTDWESVVVVVKHANLREEIKKMSMGITMDSTTDRAVLLDIQRINKVVRDTDVVLLP